MLSDFLVDKDIRRAETLPAEIYHDPAFYELQKSKVFARTWQVIPDATRMKAPGHVLPFTLLPGCLDEPLVLTLPNDGVLRCISNVCTHRGTIVVEGEGHAHQLRCRYHGRRFGLDGCFHSMPEFDDVENFPTEADHLRRLPLESIGPVRFTALDPAFPFEALIKPVMERAGFLPLERMAFDPNTSHEYLIRANWALYADNYLEEFHIPYVHQGSLSGLDYGAYRTETRDYCNLQLGIAKDGEVAFDLPAAHPNAGERVGAFYFWLFPNTMLNFYPWGLSVNVVQPVGPERTRVSFLSYVLDPSLRSGVGGDLHRVEMEDEEVVEAVQRGVKSRIYHRGRYSPRREVGTHHFHRLLTDFMR